MIKQTARLAALALFLAPPSALAETAGTTDDHPVAKPPMTAIVQPAPTPSTSVAPAKRIYALEAKVAALEAASQSNQAALATAGKLKFSGYVQGRHEWHQGATNGISYTSDGKATVTNTNRFLLRHAYLTTHYTGTNAEYFVQLDANNRDGVAFKDAHATFVDTWTPLHLRVSVGQFRYPFGYEALQSDADREMPERAPIEKFFFDGERDRGIRLQGAYKVFNFQVALVNGTLWDGSRNVSASKEPAPYGSHDPNEFKDWVGRFGLDFGAVVGGVSGYFGKGLYIKPPVAATATAPAVAAIPDSRSKVRLGADLQTYAKLPGVGLLALKGEVLYGWDTARPYRGTPADPCRSSATWGFIATAVQNLPLNLGVVARIDMRNTLASSIDDGCREKAAAAIDRVITTGGGVLYYVSPNLKLTATYEHPAEQGTNEVDNDFAMAQLQARF